MAHSVQPYESRQRDQLMGHADAAMYAAKRRSKAEKADLIAPANRMGAENSGLPCSGL